MKKFKIRNIYLTKEMILFFHELVEDIQLPDFDLFVEGDRAYYLKKLKDEEIWLKFLYKVDDWVMKQEWFNDEPDLELTIREVSPTGCVFYSPKPGSLNPQEWYEKLYEILIRRNIMTEFEAYKKGFEDGKNSCSTEIESLKGRFNEVCIELDDIYNCPIHGNLGEIDCPRC